MSELTIPVDHPELEEVIANWPKAIEIARHQVDKAQKTSLLIHRSGQTTLTRVETRAWETQIALAQGVLIALRMLKPDDADLEKLWRRVNHCPMLAMVGPDEPTGQELCSRLASMATSLVGGENP